MALQQGAVTITGYLGADPQQYGRNPSRPACTFRLGSTRRYQDRNGVWQQLPTTWLTVKAFRGLAANIMQSLHRGDPAIVTGLLNTEQWRDEQGVDHSRLVLEASNVGFHLNYVVTMSMRTPREGYTGQQAPSQMASDEQGSPCVHRPSRLRRQLLNQPCHAPLWHRAMTAAIPWIPSTRCRRIACLPMPLRACHSKGINGMRPWSHW